MITSVKAWKILCWDNDRTQNFQNQKAEVENWTTCWPTLILLALLYLPIFTGVICFHA